MTPDIHAWLMEGDPAVRWRVLREWDGAPEEAWKPERERIATEGWGADFLARRDPDGLWGGGYYSPKWVSTHYTLLLLMRLGLPGNVGVCQESAAILLEKGLGEDGGISYWKTHPQGEVCVTGMSLGMFTHFGLDRSHLDRMVSFLMNRRMADGGWNCDDIKGDTHSSFHSTLSVMEGLVRYREAYGDPGPLGPALDAALEFLLQHRIYHSHRTGEVVDSRMTLMSYPPRWKYDFMRFLDWCVSAKVSYDPRMEDALVLLEEKRDSEGRWKMQGRHTGPVFFDVERYGKPSRINTLRAELVLEHFGRPRTPR